jgi:predicted RNase H-like HicB family nuclease
MVLVLYLNEQGVAMVDVIERERIVRLHIERLPEGVYLATSEDVQGLVAQGRTVTEVVEIARDVARKLIEAQTGLSLPVVAESFDYPLVIGG